jgi:hypothetical protein
MENNPTGKIGRDNGAEMRSQSALPLPGWNAYGDLPQAPKHGALPFRRTIRRHELRLIFSFAETAIYEMKRRRILAPLQPDAALRRVGLCRNGSVDRAAQAISLRQRFEPRCSPTKNQHCPGEFE